MYNAQMALLPESDQRFAHRRIVNFAGFVRELGAVAQSVAVEDISSAGCRIANCDLAPGAEIWLKIGTTNPVRAHVVRNEGGAAGCEFYHPFDTSAVRSNRPHRQSPVFSPPKHK